MRHAHPMPFGAWIVGDGRTHFSFWAPDCERAWLEVEHAPPRPMSRNREGIFALECPCGAGTRYRFRVAPDLAVPDPAARAQADDPHGWSVVVDPRAFEWRHDAWRGRRWHDSVIYEVHAGTLGGYDGVSRELPRLRELGVTTIELMPVAEFTGTRNWGYDGVLPFAPEAAYGSPAALKALIDAAHGLGLAVMLDVVYNHFGPDGNFLARYASCFFRQDRQTPWGPAIDFRVPQVREFFIHNALYWLQEYRCDGLRLDAVHAIADDDFLLELESRVRAGVEPDRDVHLVVEDEREAHTPLRRRFDARWNEAFHNSLHVLLTGEREGYYAYYADKPALRLAHALADGNVLPQGCVAFLQNHDQVGNRAFGERLVQLAREDDLRAATLLHLLCPQVPLLFMGEEWGSRKPFLFFTDFHGALADAVREGRRQEFAKFGAYADPAQRARIPDPNDPATFTASHPGPVMPGSWLDYVRSLLACRARELAPHLWDARVLEAHPLGDAAVVARWRLEGRVLGIAANFGDTARTGAGTGEGLAESRSGVLDALARDELPPHSAAAFWEHP